MTCGNLIVAGLDLNTKDAHRFNSTFSVTVTDDEGVRKSFAAVNFSSLTRLIKDEKVDVLAFDNLAELGSSLNKLLFELSRVTRRIEFVEVAGDEQLESKAKHTGLSSGSKLSPSQSSLVVAQLARMGQGKKLDFFSPKTIVKVVRRRVPGSGGSSTLRFKRSIEGQIKFLAVRIGDKLKKAGFEYDMFVRESTGGYSSATFLVYCSAEELRGVVYPSVTRNYAVRVEKVVSRFQSKRIEHNERPLIVGYDPGISSGLAILGLDGERVALLSGKNLDRATTIECCSRYGKPVIVATDVSTPPDSVRKLSSVFGARLFVPAENLSVEEKREYSRRLDVAERPRNTHERDAYAAACKAYLHYQSLFEAIKQRVSSEGLQGHTCKVVEGVLGGKNLNQAIEEVRSRYTVEQKSAPVAHQHQREPRSELSILQNEMILLNARVAYLEQRALELESEKSQLQFKLSALQRQYEKGVLKDREVEALKLRLTEVGDKLLEAEARCIALEAKLGKPASLIARIARGDAVAVEVVEDLSSSSANQFAASRATRRQCVVFVKNPFSWSREGLATLKKYGVIGLVADHAPSNVPPSFQEAELPLIPASTVDYTPLDGCSFGVVDSGVFEVAAKLAKEYSEANRQRKMDELRRMLEKEAEG